MRGIVEGEGGRTEERGYQGTGYRMAHTASLLLLFLRLLHSSTFVGPSSEPGGASNGLGRWRSRILLQGGLDNRSGCNDGGRRSGGGGFPLVGTPVEESLARLDRLGRGYERLREQQRKRL